MRQLLQRHSNRIEAVLSLHQAPARVTGGTVTPRCLRFQVLPIQGVRISRIKGLSEELAAALDAPNCRISRRGAALSIEVPRDDPQQVHLLPLLNQLTHDNRHPIPPVTAILGLAEDGAPLLIRLPSPDVAHILIAGTTGSGKTVLLQTIILSLAITNQPHALQLLLISPKLNALTSFAPLPHLIRPVVHHVEEAAEALQSLVHLMERRTDPAPRIVVIIDELIDLLIGPGGKNIQHAIIRLAQRGREAGIHVIAATQKPATAVLGPLIKANFPTRLVGRVTSIEDARVATGQSGTGAERLTGRGDFLVIAEGRVTRFQAAHVTPPEIQQTITATFPTVRAVREPPSPAPPLLPPAPPTPDPDQELVQRLITSNLWPTRHDGGDKYRWGFKGAACQLLFDRPLAGAWDRNTRRIITLAEKSTS